MNGQPPNDEVASGGAGFGSSGGAGAIAGGAAQGGSSALGNAGQAQFPIDSGIIIPLDAGAPRSECNMLSNSAHSVTAKMVPQNPPTPEGGTLSNGIYQLTQVEDFTGPGGSSSEAPYAWRCTLAVSASTSIAADLQLICSEVSGELPRSFEQNQAIVITGTSYTSSVTCSWPADSLEAGSVSFSARTDELVLMFASSGNVPRVQTFTRQ